jgi:hypothetical protein
MDAKKTTVCLLCGAALVGNSLHTNIECTPRSGLCEQQPAHLPDLPHKNPERTRTVLVSVVTSAADTGGFLR